MSPWHLRIKNWFGPWRSLPMQAETPFTVACICGTAYRGKRGLTAQTLRCGQCGHQLLVFPVSPWPAVLGPDSVARKTAPSSPPIRAFSDPQHRRVPWALLSLALVAMLLGAVILLAYGIPPSENRAELAQRIRESFREGKAALEAGDLDGAAEKLSAAHRDVFRAQAALTTPEAENIQKLHRQLGTVRDLLDGFLEDLIEEAKQLPAETWHERFEKKYQGKAILLEGPVQVRHIGETKQLFLDYELDTGSEKGRMELDSSGDLVDQIAEVKGRAVMLGMRLKSCTLESGPGAPHGTWTVRFEPGSTILVTEPSLLRRFVAVAAPDDLTPMAKTEFVVEPPRQWESGTPALEVRAALGSPDTIVRQFSRSGLYEQWSYPGDPLVRFHFAGHGMKGLQLRLSGIRLPKMQKN